MFLPGKLNLVMVHAAAMPKITLSGTEIATVSSESFTAARVLGSSMAFRYAPTPF